MKKKKNVRKAIYKTDNCTFFLDQNSSIENQLDLSVGLKNRIQSGCSKWNKTLGSRHVT